MPCEDAVRQRTSHTGLRCGWTCGGNGAGMSLLTFEEAESILSMLWLGIELGMLPWLDMGQVLQKVTELLIAPAQLAGSTNLRKDQFRLHREMARSFRRDLLHLDVSE